MSARELVKLDAAGEVYRILRSADGLTHYVVIDTVVFPMSASDVALCMERGVVAFAREFLLRRATRPYDFDWVTFDAFNNGCGELPGSSLAVRLADYVGTKLDDLRNATPPDAGSVAFDDGGKFYLGQVLGIIKEKA